MLSVSKYALFLLFPLLACNTGTAHPQKKKKPKKEVAEAGVSEETVSVEKRWELPKNLVEISGMAPYGNYFASIQDEDGTIFMFNPKSGEVEREIPFGPFGDYEGIAIVGDTAWVLRSDGRLFELPQFARNMTAIVEFETPLNAKNNCEGLFYDEKNRRLLVSVKDKDPIGGTEYKGVYAFDLRLKKMLMDPVYRITARREAGETDQKGKGKKGKTIRPSEIAIHPKTGELYVLDGPAGGLLVLNEKSEVVREYALDKKDFPQAEGLIINSNGDIYISNEGGKGKGTILKITEPVGVATP